MTARMRDRYLDCNGLTMEEAESFANYFIEIQLSCNFWIGDLARYSERTWPSTHPQVWPAGTSDKLLARPAGVCNAYPKEEDRQIEATYSQYMQNSSQPDRLARLEAIVEKGQTSDQSRKADQEERQEGNSPRWLLAFDIYYFAHRHYYSGAGVETAMQVSEWVQRTVERLKLKGATDVLLAFEGHGSFRRELTDEAGWTDHRYKDRPDKPEDLKHQLKLVRELLEGMGFCCVSVDRYEADDVMASVAAQFPGKTTIITADKDLRQCLSLSDKTNVLLDVSWSEDETSGEMMPDYKWLTEKPPKYIMELRKAIESQRLLIGPFTKEGQLLFDGRVSELAGIHVPRNLLDESGLTPSQFLSAQTLMGDNVDGIQGAIGVGEKGAANLIQEFGTVEAAIQAAKDNHESIKPKQCEALIEFESRLEITRQLVTLRTDLSIPLNSMRV